MTTTPVTTNWYVAQLKPGGFTRALVNLRRQNVETFMPFARPKQRDTKLAKRSPLFPGYLFLSFSAEDIAFNTINCTYGVSRLVMRDAQSPQVVPHDLIQTLRARCDEQDTLLPPDQFTVGEKIKISAGPFTDFAARVEEMKAPERLQVLLEIMGQSVRVEVATDAVEKTQIA